MIIINYSYVQLHSRLLFVAASLAFLSKPNFTIPKQL